MTHPSKNVQAAARKLSKSKAKEDRANQDSRQPLYNYKSGRGIMDSPSREKAKAGKRGMRLSTINGPKP